MTAGVTIERIMEDEIIRNVMLLTLGKHLRGEKLTFSERSTYNDLIRAERALSPIHVRCETHGNDILVYDRNEDVGPNFLREGDHALCVQCDMRERSATLRTYAQI